MVPEPMMTWVAWCAVAGWATTSVLAYGYAWAMMWDDDAYTVRDWYRLHVVALLVGAAMFGPLLLSLLWVFKGTRYGLRFR